MYSGRMKARIEFLKSDYVKDDYGENELVLTSVMKCWSQKVDERIRELNANVGVVFEDTITFRVRERLTDKIDETMLLKYKEKNYEIIKIFPSDSHRIMTEVIVKKVT